MHGAPPEAAVITYSRQLYSRDFFTILNDSHNGIRFNETWDPDTPLKKNINFYANSDVTSALSQENSSKHGNEN